MASLAEWVHGEICSIVTPDIPKAYTDYILEIHDRGELTEYMQQLGGDVSSERIQTFVDTLIAKRKGVEANITVYRKGDDEEESKPSVRPKKKKEKKVVSLNEIEDTSAAKTPLDKSPRSSEKAAKKKTSYVSLYGEEGQMRTHAVLLPGRHPCECQAQKHSLINNCLGCGRVVCEQEKSGPCLFCGELVCTPEEKKVLARESNKSEKLLKKLKTVEGGASLTANSDGKGLQKAQAYKNRLLEYDRTYVQRTRVIDDESDYFAADGNVWLSAKEREVMKKKEEEIRELKFGSRLNRKVTLDFAGRRVIDEGVGDIDPPPEDILMSIAEKPLVDPTLQESFPELPMPKFIENKENKPPAKDRPKQETTKKPVISRLQDKAIQQMSDSGMCLSMHQPWASLLVKGIKRHEGRTWYSNHRGRLWIAAASHKPTPEETRTIEQQHLEYVNRDVEFPKEYPTLCLLGCVNVDDVMSQEEYRKVFPNGESGSPYVFVCSGFEELIVKVPVSGKHKIWRLPADVHQAGRKGRTVQHDEF